MSKQTRTISIGIAASLAAVLTASPVAAQMFERAYSFTGRDRASLAVVMKQAESGMFDGTGSGNSGMNYSVTNLICGGDSGSANADGNSACMILNNSTGNVGADQDSIGDQSANSDVDTTQNNGGEGSLSSALNGLNGDSDSSSGDGDLPSAQ